MDSAEIIEHLHDLQASLNDGDDLAQAISLIGDALERRMTDIRENLEELRADARGSDRDRLVEVIGRVGDTLDRYEHRIEDRHRRMKELVDKFQGSLGEQAAALSDLQAVLDSGESA